MKMFNKVSLYSFLLFSVIVVIYFRNTKALNIPSLYAEDGLWISKIIQYGFLHTAFNAREGFPVFNLVFLDYISLLICYFISPSLLELPRAVFFVSTLFFSFIALLPFIFLGKNYSFYDKLILSSITVLMPIGTTGAEVFGKIGNLVFLFPILSVYLILFYKNKNSFFRFLVTTFILFINAITFPVCLLLLIFFFFYFHVIDYLDNQNFKLSINLKKSLILLITIFICFYLYPTNFISFEGGASMPFKFSGLIDMGICRMILYPFVVSFYKVMSDYLSIIFVLVIAVYLVFSIYKRSLIVFFRSDEFVIFIGFSVFFISTIVMRSGFTSWFGSYENTFPDRYFYGINILFIQFLFLFFVKNDFIKRLILILFFMNVIFYSSKIFEFNDPKFNYEKYGSFSQMFCDMENGYIKESIKIEDGNALIPIYPVDHQFTFTFKIPYHEYIKMKNEC